MTSLLLIVLAVREKSHWVLATFPFIHGVWPIQINGSEEWRSRLQATLGFGYSHSFLTMHRPFSVSSPLLGGFNLALVSSRLGMTLDPFWRCLSSPSVMTRLIRQLGRKKLILKYLVKSILLYPTFRSDPDSGNLSWSTMPLSAQAHWKVHMCYMCFCSTLDFMLPKKI